ncbi:MAG: hypothetical protein ACJA0S_001398 [Rickettsiales bacterium]|jgi:hypothetical protein
MTTKFINSRDIDKTSGHLKSSLTNSEDWQEISSLYITGINELRNLTLDQSPSKLSVLSLSGCGNLISAHPPETVAYLVANGCTNLKTLSITSLKNLKILNLEGCENIEWNTELINHLEFLKQQGCKITYPKNHPQYAQNILDAQNIEKANAQIASLNNSSTSNLHALFNRYFAEDLTAKEMQTILAANIARSLDILDQNPEYKIWAEEIAQEFNQESIDDGDINKNAAEFFQLATWLKSSNKEGGTKKLEALMPLMAYQTITNFVEILLQEQGLEDPFEKHLLINAFLKRTHDDFRQNGKLNEDWLGVPKLLFQKKITQSSADIFGQFKNILENPIEEKLQKFLTKRNLELIGQKVAEVLEKPMEQNIDEFFANKKNIKIWEKIAFPAEYEKIENESKEFQASPKEAENDEGWFKNLKLVDLESGFFAEIIKLTKNLIPRSRPLNSPSRQRSASFELTSSKLKEEDLRPRARSASF